MKGLQLFRTRNILGFRPVRCSSHTLRSSPGIRRSSSFVPQRFYSSTNENLRERLFDLQNSAQELIEKKNFQHVEETLLTTINLSKTMNNKLAEAEAGLRLAYSYLNTKQFKSAIESYKTSIPLLKEADQNHPQLPNAYSNLAEAHSYQKEFVEATEAIQEAVKIIDSRNDENKESVKGFLLNNQAIYLSKQTKNDEAKEVCKEALGLLEGSLGITSPLTRSCAGNYARILSDLDNAALEAFETEWNSKVKTYQDNLQREGTEAFSSKVKEIDGLMERWEANAKNRWDPEGVFLPLHLIQDAYAVKRNQ